MRLMFCDLCGDERVTVDDICFGCGCYLCDWCRLNRPSGLHSLLDHKFVEEFNASTTTTEG